MLVFVDESGDPHPNDPLPTWSLAAICVPIESSRKIAAQIHRLKLSFFPSSDEMEHPLVELKASRMFNRGRFGQARQGYEQATTCLNFVAAVMDLIRGFREIAVFGVTGRRPSVEIETPPGHLPIHYRYLLQRIHRHAAALDPDRHVVVCFDQKDPRADCRLARAFSNFLFSSPEGKEMSNIVETGLFVSSQATPGVQLADLAASIMRFELELQESGELRGFNPDPFLNTVARYAAVLRAKTANVDNGPFGTLYGIGRMNMPRRPDAASGDDDSDVNDV